MPALLAVRLFLSGALGSVWKLLCHRSFWQLVSIGLMVFAGVEHFQLVSARHSAAKWEKQFTQEHAGRIADRQAYQKAQDEAKAKNIAQVQQVEQQYQRNSDNERQAYLSDRAKLIAYYDSLRRKAAPGSPGGSSVPEDHSATPGTHGNVLQVSAADDLQTQQDAAEIELRLLHLQQYVAGVLAIDPNTEARP